MRAPSTSSARYCRGDPAICVIGAVAATMLFLAGPVMSLEFDILQIDEGLRMNQDVVISDSGMVAWSASSTNDLAFTVSALVVWQEGEMREISAGHPDPHAEHIRPRVWGDQVVWGSSYPGHWSGIPSWVLVDVPDQHTPYPELDAQYRVTRVLDNLGGGTNEVTQFFSLREDPPTEEGEEAPIPRRVHRTPSGDKEILFWPGEGEFQRITWDTRNDINPTIGDGILAYQKARGFPFGWEIMVYDIETEERWQITTNRYYDMGPQAFGSLVTWYGWDGEDYEIYLYDHSDRSITQVTDNRFDDESPRIWGENIVWEGFATVEPDVYFWSRPEGRVRRISRNVEQDVNPRVWETYVVWQSFDGDDYEILFIDTSREMDPIKVTQNAFDDINPYIRDGTICWMGYVDNFDAEIFVTTVDRILNQEPPIQLTDNTHEDQNPRTAAGRVVWQSSENGRSPVYLAIPRQR